MTNTEQHINNLPTHFSVAVMMERRPSRVTVWRDYEWQAVGITVMHNGLKKTKQVQLAHEDDNTSQYLYTGFKVNLYVDECESYYHNLISPTPRCYVIAHNDENDTPVPFLVSMSFDEAHAYLEGDDDVYDVDIPPELYRWTEAFVVENYAPQKRIKRKRKNWSEPDQESNHNDTPAHR